MARCRVGSDPQPPRLGPPLRPQQLAIQPPDCALRPRRWGLPAAGCRRPLMPCRGSVACGVCASERVVALMYRIAPGPSTSAKRGLPRPSMYTTTTIHYYTRPSAARPVRVDVGRPRRGKSAARFSNAGQRWNSAGFLHGAYAGAAGCLRHGPPPTPHEWQRDASARPSHPRAALCRCSSQLHSDGTTFVPASRARAAHPLRIRVATRRDRGR